MNKSDWANVKRNSIKNGVLGLFLVFASLALLMFYDYHSSSLASPQYWAIVVAVIGGLFIGFSGLDSRLVKEYEAKTGKKW